LSPHKEEIMESVKNTQMNLYFACSEGDLTIVREILGSGFITNIDEKDEDGRTALHLASQSENPELVRELLEYGANVNEVDNEEQTALYYTNNANVARELIKANANLNHINNDGWTPLHHSSYKKRSVRVALELVRSGANVNIKTEDENLTALHLACSTGELELVMTLLQHGAKTNVKDSDGNTPEHIAYSKGFSEIVMGCKQWNK
jgi:ankyrin repeat protein